MKISDTLHGFSYESIDGDESNVIRCVYIRRF